MRYPEKPSSTDADLVALIPQLTPLARRLGHSQAEADDLLQDTLAAILQRLRAGGEIDSLSAYGRIVLKNAARRRGQFPRLEPLDNDSAMGAEPSGEGAYAALEAVAHLPAAQARLVRGALEGHDTAQLARSEGIAPGTVHSRLARARARLRADLDMG
ncbi:MAG: sigma factor-like helix-turn-helix DNA-binding protein [Pseudomonadota bacterium]